MLYNIEAYQLFSLYRLIFFCGMDTYNRLFCPGYKPAIIKDMLWILDRAILYRIYFHLYAGWYGIKVYRDTFKCIRF